MDTKKELEKSFKQIEKKILSKDVSFEEKQFLLSSLRYWLECERAKCNYVEHYYGERLENHKQQIEQQKKQAFFNNKMLLPIIEMIDSNKTENIDISKIFSFLLWVNFFDKDCTLYFIKKMNAHFGQNKEKRIQGKLSLC